LREALTGGAGFSSSSSDSSSSSASSLSLSGSTFLTTGGFFFDVDFVAVVVDFAGAVFDGG